MEYQGIRANGSSQQQYFDFTGKILKKSRQKTKKSLFAMSLISHAEFKNFIKVLNHNPNIIIGNSMEK